MSDHDDMNTETMTLKAMRARLAQVETELAETQKRMPAHSVKPVFVAALLDLEDERDRLLDRIKALCSGSP